MSLSVRLLVGLLFFILAVSFVATTAMLQLEFQNAEWMNFAVFESQHFLFFPTFGVIALITFYIPTCVLVDLYLKHVSLGWLKTLVTVILLAVLAYVISYFITRGKIPNMWQISPEVLMTDKGAALSNCDPSKQSCRNAPVLDALAKLREESRKRVGLSKFVRNCSPDPLLAEPAERLEKRYCFASKSMSTAEQCCRAQKAFTATLADMYADPGNRSQTETVNRLLLPFKSFFLLMMLTIGLSLAWWRTKIDELYPAHIPYIEKGLMAGAVAMMIWPLVNHGFLLSRHVLYGSFSDGIYAPMTPFLSLMFGAWALALLFFFFRSVEKNLEAIAKIAGLIGSAIAVLKYNELIDYSVRIAGSGADTTAFTLLIIIGLLLPAPMIFARKKSEEPPTVELAKL